jgi:hypothetical protein
VRFLNTKAPGPKKRAALPPALHKLPIN